ncbi:MAG: hypothetical protein ACREFC_06320 [Stellaceae bacterium]
MGKHHQRATHLKMPRDPIVARDFDEVISFLKQKLALPGKPPATMMPVAQKIHEYTYSLILWKFALGKMPSRGRVYIEEIASDALQILPQILSGYSKTAKLLMRGIVENTLRHIYFFDHPVEFTRINKAGKWHMTVSGMFDFMGTHPEFETTEKTFDALARLSSVYSELSTGIHGRSVKDLETRIALQSIAFDPAKAAEDAALLARMTVAANFLIAIFHHERVSNFSANDRRIILRTLPAPARQIWKEHASADDLKASRI